jgi:hypothetical protein
MPKRQKFDFPSVSRAADSPAAKTLRFLKKEEYMKFMDAVLYAVTNQFYPSALRDEGATVAEIELAEQMTRSSFTNYAQINSLSASESSTFGDKEDGNQAPLEEFDNF